MKIGFIGCGNMGEAFLKGIINSKIVKVDDIFVYAKSKNTHIKNTYNVNILSNENEITKVADIIFLGVKPNVYFAVLDKIKEDLSENKTIVTMAAGITISSMYDKLSEKRNIRIIRTMPNLPLMIGEGCIAYTFSENVLSDEREFFTELFNKIGMAIEIKENLYSAIIGASGSSPAFVYVFIEAMADAVVAAGLPRKVAYQLVAQSVVGAGKMVISTGKHPGELKDDVCSPGGTTIEGIKVLEGDRFRGAVIDGISAIIEKSEKMSKN
ncbi:MAG: pyrroline-5-carboxylate reductase [Fusobacteriaceae bacterium]|jgi:pyrroline-5-carboxylate reductase|nr:pyrroline-5-carboxylate reductase [Fusobacteriaceae bacterium]